MKVTFLATAAGIGLIVVTATVLICVGRQKNDPLPLEMTRRDRVRVEMDKLAGTWQMVAGDNDGATARDAGNHKFILITEGNYTTTMEDKPLSQGVFVLDPDSTPKTVDFKAVDGALAGRTLRCLYDLKDDELRFCYCVSGTDRPKEFSTGSGTGHVLMVYERMKAK